MIRMLRTTALALVLILGLLTSGCGAAATAPVPPTQRPQIPQLSQWPTATAAQATQPSPTGTIASATEPFTLDLTPLPTQTALPTLVLPTEPARIPSVQAWDGLPTYPAESHPGYYFRVQFDPQSWALTTDQYGAPALAHRAITNCIVSPTQGRGLPLNATTEQEIRKIGDISYQISSVSVNGVKQSATYSGGDGRIYTAFQVAVEDRPDQCLLEAETVLGTLTTIPVSEATPIATP
jgi:hypothetical protein